MIDNYALCVQSLSRVICTLSLLETLQLNDFEVASSDLRFYLASANDYLEKYLLEYGKDSH